METETKSTDSYKSLSEALISHIGLITFVSIVVLLKIGVLPYHILFVVIGGLAGVWGVFELMASKNRLLASIGWIIAMAWLFFGDRGLLSGF